MKKLLIGLSLFFLCIHAGCSNTTQEHRQKTILTISAAASLKDALLAVQKEYEKKHPTIKLRFNFGASGPLQQQISEGAPVDLFLSAAENQFQTLLKDGSIAQKDHTSLLGNELVLVVPKTLTSVASIHDLKKEAVKKVALGTPETVPAGQYAKQTLEHEHVWNALKEKAIYAKDVRQVLTYVETQNAEAGFVYKTDALISQKVKIAAITSEKSHAPIVYPLGIIKQSKHVTEARAFFQYLQQPSTKDIFLKFGFTKLPARH
ncbi:molybdate ABC transporter molybdate-binding protein ModA [Fictibacillus macauensis ZFHKF-1]|uniref:Molybdate ABC transporter molybdate-binding protein ModA n=1 Tax=Fictibacillus macauensis ZFHKF-1 TaxID=1196324 RepID=I8AN86_9BACL|nr:molybdate ABC transporter molybdate-binding protein ModA [Fictibacillus macauensis ZFHKF-1]